MSIISTTIPYIPHGHCYLWQTNLVFLHVISDGLIAIAYYSIPCILIYFLKKREDIPFKGIFILFSLFILSCGTTHLLDIWTLWYPDYWLSGIVKAITALVSIYTVFELVPIIPHALNLPNLNALITEKETAQQSVIQINTELELRIQERTKQLEESNYFIEKVFNLIPNVIYIYDLLEDKIVYCNDYITQNLGLSTHTVKNQGIELIKNLCHIEDIELFDEYWKMFTQNVKLDGLKIEYRLQDYKQSWHWLENINYVFNRDQEGNPKQIISISSDITELKKSKLSLLDLNEKLESQVDQLKLRNQEMNQLGKINDFLQVCRNFKEVENTLGELLKLLFTKLNGAVFVLNLKTNKMELLSNWGSHSDAIVDFTIPDCWALRTGDLYEVNHTHFNLYCTHNEKIASQKNTICIPMIAQGKITGLLSLQSTSEFIFTEQDINLAQTAAKQIALILANLKLQENLEYQSSRDSLTGLYNRYYFTKVFAQYLVEADELKQFLGIILLDIDYFKRINDVYGHLAGDLVLQKVANYLKESIRPEDIICRYGGEEIIILIPNTSLQQLVYRARTLQKGISSLNLSYEEQKLPKITASFGVASFPIHGKQEDTLINLADKALYQAKGKGRNRVIAAKLK